MKMLSFSELQSVLNQERLDFVKDLLSKFNKSEFELSKWYFGHQNCKCIFLNTSNFHSGIFEFHIKYADLHFTVEGNDIMYLGSKQNAIEDKKYMESDDYGLMRSDVLNTIKVPAGYSIYIEPEQLHANELQPNSTKLVVKLPI